MYRLSDSVRCACNQEHMTILDIRRGQIFNLNLTGSRILELLKSGVEASDIAGKIGLEFGVSPDAADRDVQEFIAVLEHHEVIEGVSRMSEGDRLWR